MLNNQGLLYKFQTLFKLWNGTVVAIENDKTSKFAQVAESTDPKHIAVRKEWVEMAPEVVELKSWELLQTYASSSLAESATKQLLEQAVTEGKTYRKDALAFCKAFRKAITDTQLQVTKMGNEQRKDSAAEAQRESLLQEQVVAASAVTANTPALTSKPASASSAEVFTIFAAVYLSG